jgi:hypothetical protein
MALAPSPPLPASGGGSRLSPRLKMGLHPTGMFDCRCNRFENTLPVGRNVMIVKAQNTKTFAGKVSISSGVALLVF